MCRNTLKSLVTHKLGHAQQTELMVTVVASEVVASEPSTSYHPTRLPLAPTQRTDRPYAAFASASQSAALHEHPPPLPRSCVDAQFQVKRSAFDSATQLRTMRLLAVAALIAAVGAMASPGTFAPVHAAFARAHSHAT